MMLHKPSSALHWRYIVTIGFIVAVVFEYVERRSISPTTLMGLTVNLVWVWEL